MTSVVEQPAQTPKAPVLQRLNALVNCGYKAELGEWPAVDDVVWLRHPREKPNKSRIMLTETGLVSGDSHAGTKVWIAGDDEESFKAFCSQVPKPTMWDKTAEFRYRAFAYGILIAFSAVIAVAIGAASKFVREILH